MKRYLPKYFAWISLVIIATASCCSPRILFSGEYAEHTNPSIVTGPPEKKTVRVIVIYKDKELSGSMLIKKGADGNLRVAFFSELGMTYLEGTLLTTSKKRKKFIVYNIIPVLNNTPFLRKFEKSLQKVN
ncbi:MAG: hypothetical protein MUC31_05580 [Bacteroidales bacterium]|jgi:hypothetical protein|nr:hypothetical protein [Bacteroidales bacterium]